MTGIDIAKLVRDSAIDIAVAIAIGVAIDGNRDLDFGIDITGYSAECSRGFLMQLT